MESQQDSDAPSTTEYLLGYGAANGMPAGWDIAALALAPLYLVGKVAGAGVRFVRALASRPRHRP